MRKVLLILVLATALAATVAASAQAMPQATCSPKDCTVWQQSVNLTWTDSDPAGNPALCPPSYATESSSTSGTVISCDDGASDGAGSVTVFIDRTPPTFSVSPAPDVNGWYTHEPVALTLSDKLDALSGIASCSNPPTYPGPDGKSLHIGDCTDNAGNTRPVTINVDTTPPQITSAALDRPPDRGDWYNHPVGVTPQANDLSGLASCPPVGYSGPDTATAVIHIACSDNTGHVASVDVPFKYDATGPTVTGASADRPPDHDGWYNHPVSFTFQGTDAASGIAGCSSTTYSGPVDSTAAVNGACTDKAGNIGLGNQGFKYDNVRPAAPQVQATPGNKSVDVSWSLPKDATSVTVTRSLQGSSAAPVVVYQGGASSFLDKGLTNGVKYAYAVTDSDQAGNQTTSVIRAIPTASSLRPYVGTAVSGPPLLTWKKVKRARYYNVQLWFGKKKVLSMWPRGASLQLKSTWHFRGKVYKFKPGHYRWYVWPGFGSLAAHNYGKRIGRSSFRVVRS